MNGWDAKALERATKPKGAAPERTKAPASTKDKPKPPNVAQSQEIVFNCVVPGNNGAGGLLRAHWSERGRLLQRYEWVVAAARLTPCPGPVRFELIRHSVGPLMDFDNLVSTGKLLTDALVRCGILPDDKPAVIAERDYQQVRAEGKGYQRTVIRLIPLNIHAVR